ncbi:MAG TPA: hypothetical protein PKN96_01210 [Flavobacterium sp.]|uniref:hypothetical protein n=1 Tax=Flavobacterium sp. TaxID=239 RepID=UPI002C1C060C|nr:hypothetical protein [Flavobacterium sp.]HNP31890.1 hypothetical protein [Flavobacterium sp.]
MNIIRLLESVSLDKSKIGSFSNQDFTEVKKQLIAEKENNPEIEDSHISQLLEALKKNADSFLIVLNNRILFNFLSGKDYPRTYFSNSVPAVETEKIKAFVQQFFGEELLSFFNQNLETNKFNEISHLAEAKELFPDNLNYNLKQHSLDKIDEAITALKPPYGNLSKVLYIKDSYFFAFLNQIKDNAIEEKIEHLLESVTNLYKLDHNSELANKTFSAMSRYIPFDADLAQKVKRNKDIGESNFEAHRPKKKNRTWIYVVVGIFVALRIVLFINSSNFDNFTNGNDGNYDDDTEYKSEPPKIDRYYTNMKYAIDSFQVFLADFKESEIRQMKQDVSLKTGENPFETFYKNPPTADSNHFITVTNKTGYDMVLLENTVLYDSIKMPRSAHFIKAGDALEINFNSGYTETIFNMYLGKKWATFQTVANKNPFIRNHSVLEYRFSQLVPAAEQILKTDYRFINDATISYSKGGLDIDSNGAKVNPLDEYKK